MPVPACAQEPCLLATDPIACKNRNEHMAYINHSLSVLLGAECELGRVVLERLAGG